MKNPKNIPTARELSLFEKLRVQITVVLFLSCTGFVAYGQAQLLRDINNVASDNDPNPKQLIAADSRMYFTYNNSLWRSNGSTTGTVKLKTFISISDLVTEGNTLFFSADDGITGKELWRSNGTTETTVLVKDINPGPQASSPADLLVVGRQLYFSADNGSHGRELWLSAGYERRTAMLKDIQPGPRGGDPKELRANTDGIFFTANDGKNGYEIWKSNGTAGGTIMAADVRPGDYAGSTPRHLTVSNGRLFFEAYDGGTRGRELWATNAAADGASMVKDIFAGGRSADVRNLTDVNGTLFFSADDGIHGRELWKSDGSPQGTILVKDMNPGKEGSDRSGHNVTGMGSFTNINGLLYFVAPASNNFHIFRSDGTDDGTFIVEVSFSNHPAILPQPAFTYLNGKMYFINSNDHNEGSYYPEFYLWSMPFDGTNPSMIKHLAPDDEPWNPNYKGENFPEMIAFNDHIYTFSRFKTENEETYRSIDFIRSNGTTAGTRIVKDMGESTANSNPSNFYTFKDLLYFVATPPYMPSAEVDSTFYRTDGTPQGTYAIAEMDYSDEMLGFNEKLYFTGLEQYGWGFFVTEGTRETTTVLEGTINDERPHDLTPLYGLVYYYNNYGFVKTTDGTREGIDTVASFDAVISLHNVNDQGLLQVGMERQDLWKISALGEISFVKTIRPAGYWIETPKYTFDAVIGNILYFVAHDGVHGHEIWRTDGTQAGTFMMFDLNSFDEAQDIGVENDIRSFTVYNDQLFFSALGPDSVWSLFKATGDHTYTKVVDLPQVIHSVVHRGKMYLFSGTNEMVPGTVEDQPLVKVWVSDGTSDGTEFLADIEGRGLVDHAIIGDKLYFNTKYGPQLMRTDGTVCGTFAVETGVQFAYPMEALGESLVFGAMSTGTGMEPHIYHNINDVPDPADCAQARVVANASETLTPHPNPFTEAFTMNIKGNDGDKAEVAVFTWMGSPVERFEDLAVNTEHRGIGNRWTRGRYVVRVRTKDKVETYHVVKE